VLRNQPWCAVADCTNLAADVDHIVALRDGGQPFALTNVQPLGRRHHTQNNIREVYRRK